MFYCCTNSYVYRVTDDITLEDVKSIKFHKYGNYCLFEYKDRALVRFLTNIPIVMD